MMTSQPIDSRLSAGNPKLLIDVDVVRNSSSGEHLLCQKYQQSKGEYRVYSGRLMASGVVLHKAIFFCRTRERRNSSNQNILKGDKRETSLKYWSSSFDIHQFIIMWTLSRITPSYPWGSILKHTLICQVLRLGYSSLWSSRLFPNLP